MHVKPGNSSSRASLTKWRRSEIGPKTGYSTVQCVVVCSMHACLTKEPCHNFPTHVTATSTCTHYIADIFVGAPGALPLLPHLH